MSPTRVRCPTCHRETDWAQPYRPFCSERCRLIDLGAWLSEQRSIPAESIDPPAHDKAPEHSTEHHPEHRTVQPTNKAEKTARTGKAGKTAPRPGKKL